MIKQLKKTSEPKKGCRDTDEYKGDEEYEEGCYMDLFFVCSSSGRHLPHVDDVEA
jgi:hypothetical protein